MMILIVVDFSLRIGTPTYKFLATPWLCCRSFVRQHAWFILVLFLWCHIIQTRIAKSSIGFPFSTLHLHNSLKSANTSLCLKFHLSPSHTSSKPEQLQSACNESSACREQRSQMGLSIKFFRSDFVLLEGISYMHAKTSCPPPIEYSPQHPSPNPWEIYTRACNCTARCSERPIQDILCLASWQRYLFCNFRFSWNKKIMTAIRKLQYWLFSLVLYIIKLENHDDHNLHNKSSFLCTYEDGRLFQYIRMISFRIHKWQYAKWSFSQK